MKAVQIDHYGGPGTSQLRDIPKPVPGSHEALVKLAYSGVNFMDIHTRQGKYAASRTYPQSLPTTLGIEGAGIVEQVGSRVSDFKPGDRVAYCLAWGSYAEFASVPADRLVPLPDAIPLELAAASLFHGLTAHYLAHDLGKLAPGVSCLVLAASGGIGQLLVQLGTRARATVYAVTSTEQTAAAVRRRGADAVLFYDNGRFADVARELAGGRGVDVVFDPIGTPTLRDSFRAARTKGLIVNFGSIGGSVRNIDPIELGEAGSLFLTRPRLADHIADASTMRRRASEIFAALIDGSISIDVARIYSLDQVENAHDDLENRRIVGKPLIKIS